MPLSLKAQVAAIQKAAREQNKPDEFAARVVLFWLEWHLDLSLAGNGWLDDDEETRKAISSDETQTLEFKRFLADAGIVGWYNKNLA